MRTTRTMKIKEKRTRMKTKEKRAAEDDEPNREACREPDSSARIAGGGEEA